MKNNFSHIPEKDRLDEKLERLLSGYQSPYALDTQTEQKSWKAIETELSLAKKKTNTKDVSIIALFTSHLFKYAAVFVMLISVVSFLRFYQKTIEAPRGMHLAHILPDGSSVELNAETSITYNPFWWRLNRKISLEGEGYFKVIKGSEFIVKSSKGEVKVLGTTFNVYSRNKKYKVFCNTGSVEVSNGNANVVLNPKQVASLHQHDFTVEQVGNPQDYIGWIDNHFMFDEASLQEVFQSIQRQYDVDIKVELNNFHQITYTGYFTNTKPINQTLEVVCRTVDAKFKKQSSGYLIFTTK
jgi:transmembrane sensor